jgi:carbon storage regulator CsrA
MIGDDIMIRYIGRQHGQIRLGIEAPKHLLILRKELYDLLPQHQKEKNEY